MFFCSLHWYYSWFHCPLVSLEKHNSLFYTMVLNFPFIAFWRLFITRCPSGFNSFLVCHTGLGKCKRWYIFSFVICALCPTWWIIHLLYYTLQHAVYVLTHAEHKSHAFVYHWGREIFVNRHFLMQLTVPLLKWVIVMSYTTCFVGWFSSEAYFCLLASMMCRDDRLNKGKFAYKIRWRRYKWALLKTTSHEVVKH